VFIYDSYATRKGKGTHAALDRFQEFSRKNRYVIKCDIQRYFPSIDHDILIELIKRKIACKNTLWLIEKIVRSGGFGGKGIPIGNLTSQFFANIYLNGMDHYLKERLSCRYYLRYMDDFVVFHDDKEFLWAVKDYIVHYLAKLRLQIHENKCRIFRTEKGTPFLGLTVFPNRRRLKGENVVRFKRRLKRFQALYKNGSINWKNIIQSIRAWIGHAIHADTARLRRLVIEEVVF